MEKTIRQGVGVELSESDKECIVFAINAMERYFGVEQSKDFYAYYGAEGGKLRVITKDSKPFERRFEVDLNTGIAKIKP